jgi:hypothetical protein
MVLVDVFSALAGFRPIQPLCEGFTVQHMTLQSKDEAAGSRAYSIIAISARMKQGWRAKCNDPPLNRGKECLSRLDGVVPRFIFRDAEAGPERRKLFLIKPYRSTLYLLCEELGG